MDIPTLLAIALLFALAATLYSTVGHGGASAYLAIMALFSVSELTMRPTALALNLLVAGFGTVRYIRADQFNPRLFLAFAATAIPFAFLGGRIQMPTELYRPLLGAILLASAARLLWMPSVLADRPVRPPPLSMTLPAGAAIGLLAGLTGTGGGIFLSPLALLLGWERPRRMSGVAAAFIFVNSLAGLAGNFSSVRRLPPELPVFLGAVAIGALVGLWLGVSRLPRQRLLQVLGIVLLLAGGKLILT